MHLARAVGREGIVISVNLSGPEDVRIVFGAVDGIKESAGLLLRLFNQRRERLKPGRGASASVPVTGGR